MLRIFGSKKHPRGPDWSKGREHCLDFSGTKFYFYVPDYTSPHGSFEPKPEKYNIYDESIFWKSSIFMMSLFSGKAQIQIILPVF